MDPLRLRGAEGMMGGDLGEWIHLLVRWLHVVAGAFWIGQTALFSWLDAQGGHRRVAQRSVGEGGAALAVAPAVDAHAWMIHSGGFYRVERVPAPAGVPAGLKWFRWEAATTWLSGFLLLNLLYYHGGMMVEPGARIGTIAASAIGVATLVGGWLVYDGLWRTPLERREPLGVAISLALLAVVAWGLTEVTTGRAAYIHVGALFGTIMAANVWGRILPAQRRMVRAIERGESWDPALAARAKQRSKHNSYLTIPLVFLMLSTHFPTTSYGHRLNWALLWVFLVGGYAARVILNAADRRGAAGPAR